MLTKLEKSTTMELLIFKFHTMGTRNAPGEGNNIPNTLPQNNEQKVNAVKKFVWASLLVLSVQAWAVDKPIDVNHIPSVRSTSTLVSTIQSTDVRWNTTTKVDNGTVDLRMNTKSTEKNGSKVTSELLPDGSGVNLIDGSGSKMSVTWSELKGLPLDQQGIIIQMLHDDQKKAYQAFLLSQPSPSPSVSLQGTKELGYGQMASNGESFEKLAALSSEEMGKLPPKIQEELEGYIDQQVKQKKEVIVSLDKSNDQKKEVIVSLDKSNNQKKEVIVSLDKSNDQKKEVIVSLDKKIAWQKEELWRTVAKVVPQLLAEAKAGNKVIVSKTMKESIQMMADGKIPPPEMRAFAKELLTYMN